MDAFRKKVIAAIVFWAIIIAAGAGYFFRQPISDFLKKSPWKPKVEEKTEVKSGLELPSGFPADIPVEKGAVLEQSYEKDYPENLKQLTVVFKSKKTADDNYGIYEGFLKEKNWNIINAHKEGEIYNLYGKKDNQDINIVIIKNKEQAGISNISISIVLGGVAEIKTEMPVFDPLVTDKYVIVSGKVIEVSSENTLKIQINPDSNWTAKDFTNRGDISITVNKETVIRKDSGKKDKNGIPIFVDLKLSDIKLENLVMIYLNKEKIETELSAIGVAILNFKEFPEKQ